MALRIAATNRLWALVNVTSQRFCCSSWLVDAGSSAAASDEAAVLATVALHFSLNPLEGLLGLAATGAVSSNGLAS
jgi:hypothetical protein